MFNSPSSNFFSLDMLEAIKTLEAFYSPDDEEDFVFIHNRNIAFYMLG
jgi:hypothetical protein